MSNHELKLELVPRGGYIAPQHETQGWTGPQQLFPSFACPDRLEQSGGFRRGQGTPHLESGGIPCILSPDETLLEVVTGKTVFYARRTGRPAAITLGPIVLAGWNRRGWTEEVRARQRECSAVQRNTVLWSALTRVFFRLHTSQASVTTVRRPLGGIGAVLCAKREGSSALLGFAASMRTYGYSIPGWTLEKEHDVSQTGVRALRTRQAMCK
jgi:hypothetical protein